MGAPGRGGGGFRGQPGGAGPMNMGVRGGMINNPMANMTMNLGVPNMFGMGMPMAMPGMGGLNGGVGPGGFMGGRGGGHQGGYVGRGGGMSSGPRGRGGMNGLGTSF